jgi:negative regulator of flagellin synthesis FlgM
MKIGSLDKQAAVTALQNDRKAQAAAKDGPQAAGQPSATVAISPEASLLSGAMADPSFDAEKVERLAQAIKEGKFEVDADKIADKLLSNARELLGRQSS